METPTAPVEIAPVDPDEITIDMSPRQASIEIADGMVAATLTNIRVEDNPFEPKKKRRVWEFTPDGKDGALFFYTSPGTGPKIQEAVTAIGCKFDPTGKTSLKKSDMIGKRCQLFVQNTPSKNDPTKKFPRIKALLQLAA